MKFKPHPSGILVPAPPPNQEPPKRRYGPLQLQDPQRRALAREALLKLWDAMALSDGSAIRLPGSDSAETHVAYSGIYEFVGTILLGDDCPEKEIFS